MKKTRGGFVGVAVGIIIALLVVVGGGYFYVKNGTVNVDQEQEDLLTTSSDTESNGDDILSIIQPVAETKSVPAGATTKVAPPQGTQQKTSQESAQADSKKTYRHSSFGFSLSYSSNLKYEEGFIKPTTYYVIWKNTAGQVTSVVYINEGSLPLTSVEKAKGTAVTVGGKSALKYVTSKGTTYFVQTTKYAASIYIPASAALGATIDISSITF